jgi:hypothetical protein
MISDYVLWPMMLLADWAPTPQPMASTVEEAAPTVHAVWQVRERSSLRSGSMPCARPGA